MYYFLLYYIMMIQQTQNQTMGTYGIYGTHITETCPLFNTESKKLILHVASTFEQDANAKGIKIISMYHSGLTLFFGYVFMHILRKFLSGAIWLHGIIFGILVTITAVWFGMFPALGSGVAGLNIAPEVPVMTMSRHIIFGAVISILSKPFFEVRK